MNLVHAAAVDDVLARDDGALHLADDGAELLERAVVLRAAKEAHLAVWNVEVGELDGPAILADKGAAADVLVREGLAEDPRGRGHGTAEELGDLLEEVLVERASLFLELVGVKVLELDIRLAELDAGGSVLALQDRHDRGNVLEVPLLEEALEEYTEAESAARPLPPSDNAFRVGDVVSMSRFDDESDDTYDSLGRVEAVRLIRITPYHEYDVRFEDGSMETTFSEDDIKRPDAAIVVDDSDDSGGDNPTESPPAVEDGANDEAEHKDDEENLAMGLALSLSLAPASSE